MINMGEIVAPLKSMANLTLLFLNPELQLNISKEKSLIFMTSKIMSLC